MAPGVDPTLSAFFERPAPELQADGWDRLELGPGAQLWRHGEEADSLAWVETGGVRVEVGGVERGRIGPGELLGEASAFIPKEQRSADVVAHEPTRLWVLRRAMLSHLRGNNVRFYDMILRSAIATVAQRISDNDQQLSRQRAGQDRSKADAPTLWTRFRRSFERPDTPPPAADTLAALPNIPTTGILAEDLAAIAEPLWVKTGKALCIEGDLAKSMYIVARGALRVMLSTTEGPIELARSGPGALLGTAALLHDCERTASLVAAEPTWVYELSRERVDTLSAGAWRILAESLLAVMREQLVHTHQR